MTFCGAPARADVLVHPHASPRVRYGAEKLTDALHAAGSTTSITIATIRGTREEGFSIRSESNGSVLVEGSDDSGTLYGCLELARRIREAKKVPADLNFS